MADSFDQPEPASRGSAGPAQPAWMHVGEKPERRSGCGGPALGCMIGVGVTVLLGAALAVVIGLKVFVDQAEDALRASPVIARHLGELESVDFLWLESMAHPGMETFVFRLRGSRASGKAEAELTTIDADTEALTGGVLILDSGETFDLVADEARGPEPEP